MATIRELIPSIYFEKQEPGTALCAQHALNSLLRESYELPFTDSATDLFFRFRTEAHYVSLCLICRSPNRPDTSGSVFPRRAC